MTRALLVGCVLCAFTTLAGDPRSEAAAADLLRKRLANEDPQARAMLDAVKGKDIVVVAGSMDHIEQVLAAAKLPFTMIQPAQVATTELSSSMILMVNCPGVMPADSLRRVERFVRAGGLLYTTDWALKNVVEQVFPNTIKHNGQSTGNEVVPVLVDEKSDNLMSQMLLRKGSEPQWWLEGSSYPIQVLDGKRVKVLAHSKVLGEKYGSSPIVVRFPYEDGEVIHVVSHFVRQMATTGPAVAAKDAKIDGLTAAQAADFAASGAATATIGDVESSYAFQRMTTNVVTTKQKKNAELDRAYNFTSGVAVPLRAQPAAAAPPVGTNKAGAKVKVLERRDGQARVRNEFGDEGWVDEKSLIAR
ncbi:MAG: SH3 domain-containing protein [Myxococcaceae bacterium]|nr:SH3 domain-containing protein [Myxococcaceae bacterium]